MHFKKFLSSPVFWFLIIFAIFANGVFHLSNVNHTQETKKENKIVTEEDYDFSFNYIDDFVDITLADESVTRSNEEDLKYKFSENEEYYNIARSLFDRVLFDGKPISDLTSEFTICDFNTFDPNNFNAISYFPSGDGGLIFHYGVTNLDNIEVVGVQTTLHDSYVIPNFLQAEGCDFIKNSGYLPTLSDIFPESDLNSNQRRLALSPLQKVLQITKPFYKTNFVRNLIKLRNDQINKLDDFDQKVLNYQDYGRTYLCDDKSFYFAHANYTFHIVEFYKMVELKPQLQGYSILNLNQGISTLNHDYSILSCEQIKSANYTEIIN